MPLPQHPHRPSCRIPATLLRWTRYALALDDLTMASSNSAKFRTIVCLESESYDAGSPEETAGADILVHKPGISSI